MAALIGNTAGAAVKLWDRVAHQQTFSRLVFRQNNLIGKDIGGEGKLDGDVPYFPIVEKEEFGKRKKGDRVRMHLFRQLSGTPIYEAATRAGNETTMVIDTQDVDVSVAWIGNKINDYAASDIRTQFNLEQKCLELLGTRMARWLDNEFFYTYYYGYSQNNIGNSISGCSATRHTNWLYASGASPGWTAAKEGGMDSDHKMSTRVINMGKVYLTEHLNAPPIMWKGKACYLAFVHSFQNNDLFEDPTWVASAQRAAMPGDDNPLWTGAVGMWNNVWIHVADQIDSANGTWSSSDGVEGGENVRRAIFTGAHALAFGIGQEAKRTVLNEDDHQSNLARGLEVIYGVKRLDWTVGNQSSCIISTRAAAPYNVQG